MSYVFVDISANRVYRNYNGLQLAEMTAPVTPGSGWGHLYAKSDGKIYFKNDAGTEYDLTDTVGAGAAVWGSITGTLSSQTDLQTALNAKENSLGFTAVPNTRTVNGHALSADVTVTKGDVGLGSVENTALSTWAGTTNITTLGTITTGTWSATAIALNKITAVTASRALVSDGSGFMSASAVTATELGYLSGVTSAIQTQLDARTMIVGTPVHTTGNTASIAATTLYAVPADGFYTITVQLAVTTTGGTSIGCQIKFTNVADNVVKTMPSNNNNGINQCASTSTGNAICYTVTAYCKSGTNIQYVVNVTGAAGVQYSLDAFVLDNN